MRGFAPGDRVYNLRPFFGKRVKALPLADRELRRKGTVLYITDSGEPWIRWDSGYECAVTPHSRKLRLLTVVDELANLV